MRMLMNKAEKFLLNLLSGSDIPLSLPLPFTGPSRTQEFN